MQLAIILAGYNYRLLYGATATLVIVLLTMPLWVPLMRSYSLASPILVMVAILPFVGVYLAELSKFDHVVSAGSQRITLLNFLSGAAVLVVILWGRLLFPLYRVAILYGIGVIAFSFLETSLSFKFDLATPLTIIFVGGLHERTKRIVPAALISVIGLYAVLDEGRSFFAFCVVAASLTIWQLRPTGGDRPPNRWFPVVLFTGLGLAVYTLATSLLTGGYFGTVLQQRSIAQIDATGSLIAGGRPEWSAARELFKSRPRGFGVGVVPNIYDLQNAKAGLSSINVDTGGYLNNYMLGGQFRLHSVISDMWSGYGFIGLALAALVVFVLVRNMSFLIAERQGATVMLFTSGLALWYMAFGPLYSNWKDICFAMGLSMLPKTWIARRRAAAEE